LLQSFFNWLGGLSQGAASFLGSFTGAAIGLLAILAGALFNAYLNRRRDDRLRLLEARAAATALKAELSAINETLVQNITDAQTKPPASGEGYYVPDLSQGIRAFPHKQAINAPSNRRAIYVPGTHADDLMKLDRKTRNYVQAAVAKLDAFLESTR
jgi:hypothetical protein